MNRIKTIALVAHDNRKRDLVEWVEWNDEVLLQHNLVCTGTTGRQLEETLKRKMAVEKSPGVLKGITLLESGPWGALSSWAPSLPKGGSTF